MQTIHTYVVKHSYCGDTSEFLCTDEHRSQRPKISLINAYLFPMNEKLVIWKIKFSSIPSANKLLELLERKF